MQRFSQQRGKPESNAAAQQRRNKLGPGKSSRQGLQHGRLQHTALQKAIIASSKTKILVCDHSKFDKHAIEKICSLSEIDMIVTDEGINSETYERYSKFVKIIK